MTLSCICWWVVSWTPFPETWTSFFFFFWKKIKLLFIFLQKNEKRNRRGKRGDKLGQAFGECGGVPKQSWLKLNPNKSGFVAGVGGRYRVGVLTSSSWQCILDHQEIGCFSVCFSLYGGPSLTSCQAGVFAILPGPEMGFLLVTPCPSHNNQQPTLHLLLSF